VDQVKQQERRVFACSKDQEGEEGRVAITVSNGGGNVRSRLEGLPGFVFQVRFIVVRVVSWDIFQEVGGPGASCSMVDCSNTGRGDTGGPSKPGLHPHFQFRPWPLSPVICLEPEGPNILPLRVTRREDYKKAVLLVADRKK